jgi:two-component system response regulator HydG
MNGHMKIMVVDDELIVRESLYHWFKKGGHRVEAAASGREALEMLDKMPFDLLFVDIKMPGMDGIELLGKVKADYPDTEVVIITAYGSIESAVDAMKLGASDYLLKPFKPDQLSLVMSKIARQKKLTTEYNYLKDRLEKITRFDNIIGASPGMESIFRIIPEVAGSDSSVLISGETGTGKELVARAIHSASPRANHPFIAINCGAIPDSLLETELFGHQKGAFTDAVQARKGFLEVVCGGTLFLDEVGEISAKMQVDLLRVLEDKKFERIGSRQTLQTDFRLISATSRHLEKRIAERRFREDFYYRINVIKIEIPPLRDRKEDIALLVAHFLRKYSQETAKQVDRITRRAEKLLQQYDWPGNVRELKNVIERAVVLSQSRTLHANDFPFLSRGAENGKRRSLKQLEQDHIRKMLQEHEWNITRTADILGINRATLHKKIKRYRLKRDR